MSTSVSPASKARPSRLKGEESDAKANEVRGQILDAAARAFVDRGYAATSIDTIAELMQATKGLIYYYFKSKGDLYLAIHLQAMELSLSTIRPVVDSADPPSIRLRKMIATHCDQLISNFAMHKVSLEGVNAHMSGSTTPVQRQTLNALIKMRREYEQLYVDVIDEGVKSGEFRFLDTKIAVKLLLGSVNWMTIWFRPERSLSMETNVHIIDEAVELAMHAVAAHGSNRSGR